MNVEGYGEFTRTDLAKIAGSTRLSSPFTAVYYPQGEAFGQPQRFVVCAWSEHAGYALKGLTAILAGSGHRSCSSSAE